MRQIIMSGTDILKEVHISTFDDLMSFCKHDQVSKKKMNDLLTVFIKAFFIEYEHLSKSEMIEKAEAYQKKWGNSKAERPLFIDDIF